MGGAVSALTVVIVMWTILLVLVQVSRGHIVNNSNAFIPNNHTNNNSRILSKHTTSRQLETPVGTKRILVVRVELSDKQPTQLGPQLSDNVFGTSGD